MVKKEPALKDLLYMFVEGVSESPSEDFSIIWETVGVQCGPNYLMGTGDQSQTFPMISEYASHVFTQGVCNSREGFYTWKGLY